jgi:hypothetical protein
MRDSNMPSEIDVSVNSTTNVVTVTVQPDGCTPSVTVTGPGIVSIMASGGTGGQPYVYTISGLSPGSTYVITVTCGGTDDITEITTQTTTVQTASRFFLNGEANRRRKRARASRLRGKGAKSAAPAEKS